MSEIDFVVFRNAVQKQFEKMVGMGPLFVTDTDKDELWETYLNSFPEGSNPLFRERTEHDCQCCKQFIRTIGSVVAIKGGRVHSIWDVGDIGEPYQTVARALSKTIILNPVSDIFLYRERVVGVDHNFDTHTTDPVLRFSHFQQNLPEACVKDENRAQIRGAARTDKEVLERSLNEITKEAAVTVLELIEQGSLYRGAEHTAAVELFIRLHKGFTRAKDKDLFLWLEAVKLRGVARIRNTVIGTLMSDISNGVGLSEAVRMFEAKVAPENYKRPTALITEGMIKKAKEKVAELGIEKSLPRRYAVTDDITINNVLFADRSSKSKMGIFEELASEVATDPAKFDKVETVPVDKFIEHVLPAADSIELLFENRLRKNLMSVVAPVNADAPNILAWDNNFSWTYKGDVTDSIKERVKAAGGNVEGVLRCSLSWFNSDDLDIHVYEPDGNHIYYSSARRRHPSSGVLDVDMNAGGVRSRTPVENIVWTDGNRMQEGVYTLVVNNYAKREKTDVGFVVEVEYGGRITTFPYSKDVRGAEKVTVATFSYSKKEGITFIKTLDSTEVSVKEWGLKTQNFVPVSMVMQSPNHWDGHKTGNKHWFFILEGCKQEGKARGLYNEFLNQSLTEHRKVFEVLGAKMKADESDAQLSGVGFSSTKRDSVMVKVTGSFSRVINVKF